MNVATYLIDFLLDYKILGYGPPRADHGQDYGHNNYDHHRSFTYPENNYAERKEFIMYGKTPKKIRIYDDKPQYYPNNYGNQKGKNKFRV